LKLASSDFTSENWTLVSKRSAARYFAIPLVNLNSSYNNKPNKCCHPFLHNPLVSYRVIIRLYALV
jgi:hypothetical protein